MDIPVPDGYNYKNIKSDVDECIFRLKEVTEKDQAFTWLAKFQFLSKTTWRILRTYPNCGRHHAYKVDMRCAHATTKSLKGIRSSKQTGCRATLQIIIKKVKEIVPAGQENLDNDWPTIITLRGSHNHELDTAEVLKYRDLSESSFSKLREFFRKGHSASSALESLKIELLAEYGDKYYEIAEDGYYVPSYSIAHKLYEKEFISIYEPFTDDNLKGQLDVTKKTRARPFTGDNLKGQLDMTKKTRAKPFTSDNLKGQLDMTKKTRAKPSTSDNLKGQLDVTKKTRETMLSMATGKKARSNWHEPLKETAVNVYIESIDSDIEEDGPNLHDTLDDTSTSHDQVPSVSNEAKEKFNILVQRIMSGIEAAPEIYVPAFNKMIYNYEKFASTEVGLITAMRTFAKYNALAYNCSKKLVKRSRATKIGVQPTAIGRRKKCFAGKKKFCVGREREKVQVQPSIKCHNNISFGSLPMRMKKEIP